MGRGNGAPGASGNQMNSPGVTDLIRIGMNEWFAPQISEHWPANRPTRFAMIKVWLIRPGMASTLTPIEGTAQEWMTSADVTNTRVEVMTGISIGSLTFRRRLSFDLSMNLSTFISFRPVYS